MGLIGQNLAEINKIIAMATEQASRKAGSAVLVAVSKTFTSDQIRPALEAGQRIFGENRVQESYAKWPELIEEFPDTELHLIGPLQSNKAKEAVALFDVIHTVDREKIARVLAREIRVQEKHVRLFVQVNTGEEPQKAGVATGEAVGFVERCRNVHGLDICGLMCIPPFDENPGPHFALLEKLAKQAGVECLSMGMSADFEIAIQFGATHVRVGSAIFGARDYP
jgi:pyridoxal phosphate enzyme (YggS family)